MSILISRTSPGEILQLIRSEEAPTRKSLMERTGLARSTINQRIDMLSRAKLVKEDGEARSSGGRPPMLLRFNSDAGLLLAVNLSTNDCTIAVTNLDGAVIVERTFPIRIDEMPGKLLTHVSRELRSAVQASGLARRRIFAVGIGIPGPIDYNGTIIHPPAMPGWHATRVADYFEDFHAPVLVDNDVHLMALAEYATHYESSQTLQFVKVSSGVGSGIISGGEIFRGSEGAAGSIGHIQFEEFSDRVCGCGNRGCVQAIASIKAIERTLVEAGHAIESISDILDLLAAGHPDAINAVRSAGATLGRAIASAVAIINPSIVVVGGELAEQNDLLVSEIREVVYRRAPPLATRNLQIVSSRLGGRAGVRGAALLAARHALAPTNVDALLDVSN